MAMSIARKAAEAWKGLTGEKGDFAATYATRVAWDSWGMRGRSIWDWQASTRAYGRDMHSTPTSRLQQTIPALGAIARVPTKPRQAREPSSPSDGETRKLGNWHLFAT